MSRIVSALVAEGVPERVAEAIDYSYDAGREPVACYLARISTQIWDAGAEFGGRNDRDVPAAMRAPGREAAA